MKEKEKKICKIDSIYMWQKYFNDLTDTYW